MTFVITYRDPRYPNSGGASFVGNTLQVREAIEHLRSKGYQVTRISPPPELPYFERPK